MPSSISPARGSLSAPPAFWDRLLAIKIIGAALAPFTGGTSLPIAQAASQIVSVTEKAAQANWGNLGQIVQNVVAFGVEVQAPVTALASIAGVQVPTPDFLINAQASAQEFFKSAKPLIDDAKTLFEQTKNNRDLVNLVQFAAQGVQVKFDQGVIRLDVNLNSLPAVQIRDDGLNDTLRNVLLGGNAIISNMENRVKVLSQLPLLTDEELRKALDEALPELVKEMPPECRQKIERLGGALRDAESARKRLRDWVKNAKPDALQAFAQILGSGAIITLDNDNNVLVVERPVTEELRKVQARAKALQQRVIGGTVQKVIQAIEQQKEVLNAAIRQAEQQRDANTLRDIANRTIPGVIENLCGDDSGQDQGGLLGDLSRQIDEARGELEDKRLAADAAGLDKAAAEAFELAAKYQAEAALVSLQKALLLRGYSEQQRLAAEAKLRSAELELAAATLRWDRARRSLDHAYQTCLRLGIDPTTGKECTSLEPSLAGVLVRNSRSAVVQAQWTKLHKMVREYLGVLQWVDLLLVSFPAPPDEPEKVPEGAKAEQAAPKGAEKRDLQGPKDADSSQKGQIQGAESLGAQSAVAQLSTARGKYLELLTKMATVEQSDIIVQAISQYIRQEAETCLDGIQASRWIAVRGDQQIVKPALCQVFRFETESQRNSDPLLSVLREDQRRAAAFRLTFSFIAYNAPPFRTRDGAMETPNGGQVDNDRPQGLIFASIEENAAFCAIPASIAVVSKRFANNYEYIVIPPVNGNVLPFGRPLRYPKVSTPPVHVQDAIDAVAYLRACSEACTKWATDWCFSGLYGEWNVVLLYKQGARADLPMDLEDFTIYIPVIRFSPGSGPKLARDGKVETPYALISYRGVTLEDLAGSTETPRRSARAFGITEGLDSPPVPHLIVTLPSGDVEMAEKIARQAMEPILRDQGWDPNLVHWQVQTPAGIGKPKKQKEVMYAH